MADPQAILRFLRDPNLQTGPFPQWPTLPPMPPGAQLRNAAPRPADAMAPVSEALSPTMGAYGTGQIAADTALKAAQGDYAGVAANTPFIMGALKGPVRRPNPIKAFHGSPHDFNEFSMDKIGTGEGAQAYGHGLYFAENENVARQYRDDLLESGNFKPPGRMYEVALHATPESFLDWGKSISEQSQTAQQVLKGLAPEKFGDDLQSLIYWRGKDLAPQLGEAGIPGVRYLDQGSRHAGDAANAQIVPADGGFRVQYANHNVFYPTREAAEAALAEQKASAPKLTYNYSIWSPEIIEILRKYGIIAAPTAGAIAAALSNPSDQQQ